MAETQSQYGLEEVARQGEEIFERDIRSQVVEEDPQSFLLIDIDTGDYEVDADEMAAFERLQSRCPEARIYFRLVGSRVSRSFGGRAESAGSSDS